MAADTDPALQALLLPLDDGRLAWPEDGVLFLRARAGAALAPYRHRGPVVEQGFRPEAEALERAGYTLAAPDDTRRYPLVLVLPPRQREEARALYAHALQRLAPGGRIVASVANIEGAKSAQTDLATLAGPLQVLSKHKCRVFWTAPLDGPADAALATQWAALDAPRPIEGGRFTSRPGVFAWNRIDPASRLLAEHLPTDLAGRAADLGAGYGYLAVELLQRCPRITTLDLYEAEARALELARHNLASFADRATLGFHWHDVTAGLPCRYDVIVSNPPFHAQGRTERPDIGRAFITAAAAALEPGGRLWLVANRHLPYEGALATGFTNVRTVAQSGGFKIVEATRAR